MLYGVDRLYKRIKDPNIKNKHFIFMILPIYEITKRRSKIYLPIGKTKKVQS